MPRGRPKGAKNKATLSKEEAREILREIVKANLNDLVSAQLANAKGLKYLVVRDKKTGKFERVSEAMARVAQEGDGKELIEVWEKDPSIAAFTDLLNRTLDMPAKPLEEHKVNGTLVVKWEDE